MQITFAIINAQDQNNLKEMHVFVMFVVCFQFALFVFFSVDQLVKNGITSATVSEVLQGYSASRAIDGDKSQDISRCSHTSDRAGITEAWLLIDLKGTYSLKSIKFWYRKYNVVRHMYVKNTVVFFQIHIAKVQKRVY